MQYIILILDDNIILQDRNLSSCMSDLMDQSVRQSYLQYNGALSPKSYHPEYIKTIAQPPTFKNQELISLITLSRQKNIKTKRNKLRREITFTKQSVRQSVMRKNTKNIKSINIEEQIDRRSTPYLNRNLMKGSGLSKKSSTLKQKKNISTNLQVSQCDWLIIKQMELKSSIQNHGRFKEQINKIKTQVSQGKHTRKNSILFDNKRNLQSKEQRMKKMRLQSDRRKYIDYKKKSSYIFHQDKTIKKKISNSPIDFSQDLNIIIDKKESQGQIIQMLPDKDLNNDLNLQIKIKISCRGDKNPMSTIRSKNHCSFAEYLKKLEKNSNKYGCYDTLNGILNSSKFNLELKPQNKRIRPKSSFVDRRNFITVLQGNKKSNKIGQHIREMTGWQSHVDLERQLQF